MFQGRPGNAGCPPSLGELLGLRPERLPRGARNKTALQSCCSNRFLLDKVSSGVENEAGFRHYTSDDCDNPY